VRSFRPRVGEVNHEDGQVPKPALWTSDLLSVTVAHQWMYTDVLMWWKEHQEEFPRLDRMTRHKLNVTASSASPERLFYQCGFVKSDLRGSMWAKKNKP